MPYAAGRKYPYTAKGKAAAKKAKRMATKKRAATRRKK